MNTDDILDSWYNTKEEIALLEKKCEKYKKAIINIMDAEGSDEVKNKFYKVSRRIISKKTVSMESLPKDIAEKYSKETVYSSLYISQNKKSTLK
jgi:hypothetical protein